MNLPPSSGKVRKTYRTCMMLAIFNFSLCSAAHAVTFEYDAQHKLTKATYEDGMTIEYTYDEAGNRLTRTITAATTPAVDTDGDGLTDSEETDNFATDPNSTDSDNDGISDYDEIVYWGGDWNSDIDNDGLIAVLDPDSDGDGVTDGTELTQGTDPAMASSVLIASVTLENSEDGTTSRWQMYDDDPAGATITNVYDQDKSSQVIELSGSGQDNAYLLANDDQSYWNLSGYPVFSWSMLYSESFTVFFALETTQGTRYMYYTPRTDSDLGTGQYIHHGIGSTVVTGSWFTTVRDLEYDLKTAQPDNELVSVTAMLVKGSGRIDDVIAYKDIPTNLDSDGDSITDRDERDTYGTSPYAADTDQDGIDDGEELTYWGDAWNADSDVDGVINLLDQDADNDGITDGLEKEAGTDPADVTSIPDSIVYEDAEDGTISGWQIYDNDPTGAVITNSYDSDLGSYVIQFSGDGTNNGYQLSKIDLSDWNNTSFTKYSWKMQFAEDFIAAFMTQTTQGTRYIYYTPVGSDSLGTGTYVHHGLGAATMDGTWQTITRDLETDLKDAQPDNDLISVDGFYIFGNGKVDDVQAVTE
ncbi:RHS repeat protein [Desulfogranum japonicum]|uniref:RHS repeat protein n=1 Tax=Desulfogranum japonicum TaxID=231447 RepID=UPI001378F2BB|nr:RHS repeat protein [Desulfogranum japonicum]